MEFPDTGTKDEAARCVMVVLLICYMPSIITYINFSWMPRAHSHQIRVLGGPRIPTPDRKLTENCCWGQTQGRPTRSHPFTYVAGGTTGGVHGLTDRFVFLCALARLAPTVPPHLNGLSSALAVATVPAGCRESVPPELASSCPTYTSKPGLPHVDEFSGAHCYAGKLF
jgi:hypothetical protein